MVNVLVDSQTAGDPQNFNTAAGEEWYAGNFNASQTYTVTLVELYMTKTGAPGGTMTIELWSTSAGEPSAVITNGTSGGVTVSTISSGTWQGFTFATNPLLTSGTDYWIVCKISVLNDASNYLNVHKDTANTGTLGVRRDNNMAAPLNYSADHAFAFKTYKEQTITAVGFFGASGLS